MLSDGVTLLSLCEETVDQECVMDPHNATQEPLLRAVAILEDPDAQWTPRAAAQAMRLGPEY